MKLAMLFLAAMYLPAATIYHTRPTFEAALVSPTTITFEGVPPSGGQVYYGGSGLTISGVTINATNNNLYALSSTDPFTVAMNASLGTGAYMEGSYNSTCCGSGDTNFTLPAGILAFGIDFRSYNQQLGPDGITGSFRFHFLTTGGPIIVDKSASAVSFIGIVADNPILGVMVMPLGDNPNHSNFAQFLHFDNVTISNQAIQNSETPELSTFALTATALLIPRLSLLYSRKRNILFNGL
ncbi:MAG: hypothetical protein JST93_17875 [Acidobacteria bacterium]|nr:hypothetical protein [Acidobacteriota bacterium]